MEPEGDRLAPLLGNLDIFPNGLILEFLLKLDIGVKVSYCAVGRDFTKAVSTDGTVYTWGNNSSYYFSKEITLNKSS